MMAIESKGTELDKNTRAINVILKITGNLGKKLYGKKIILQLKEKCLSVMM
jgi:hypothetical protein